MSISKITHQANVRQRRSEPFIRGMILLALESLVLSRKAQAAPQNDPGFRGLRAAFTLQSWKCSDWSVSWISGSRFPEGCCCGCCCCEAEDEPAVRPSSTFLMLNFRMVSAGRPPQPGRGGKWVSPGWGHEPRARAASTEDPEEWQRVGARGWGRRRPGRSKR